MGISFDKNFLFVSLFYQKILVSQNCNFLWKHVHLSYVFVRRTSCPEEIFLSKAKLESDKPTEADPLQSGHQLSC